jgi:hypothetical protein
MLADALWDALNLDPATLERRSAFFMKYVESLTRGQDPSVDDLILRAELGNLDGGTPLTWLEAPRLEDELSGLAAERTSGSSTAAEHAVRADALREAALAALPIDVPGGVGLLRSSGRAYKDAEVPYAAFLIALADPDERAAVGAALTLIRAWPGPPDPDRLAHSTHSTHSTDAPNEPGPGPADYQPPLLDGLTAAARDPAQQLYLALAVCQHHLLAREYSQLFDRLVAQPFGRSAIPFGTTGIALRDWWSLVSELSALGVDDALRDRLRTRLRDFAAAHGRQLAYAQGTAEWSQGRAAVDIVDLDIAGATCLAVRLMRLAGLTPLNEDDFADVEPLAMVSLAIGLSMARGDDEPERVPGFFSIGGGPSSGASGQSGDTGEVPNPRSPNLQLELGGSAADAPA